MFSGPRAPKAPRPSMPPMSGLFLPRTRKPLTPVASKGRIRVSGRSEARGHRQNPRDVPEHAAAACTALWDVAFSGTNSPAGAGGPGRPSRRQKRIFGGAVGTQREHRWIAAAWLASLGFKEAIPALKQALAKEKQEPTAGSIMVALESLGVPLDEFIDTDGLLKEAQVLLAKGVPKQLSSIDLDHLLPGFDRPAARPMHGGPPVDDRAKLKLKSPETGPRLRQYASYFDRADAEEFGQHVLESWIAHDTIRARRAGTRSCRGSRLKWPGFPAVPAAVFGTRADWCRRATMRSSRNQSQRQNEKGVLAVAGACCGRRAVPVISII